MEEEKARNLVILHVWVRSDYDHGVVLDPGKTMVLNEDNLLVRCKEDEQAVPYLEVIRDVDLPQDQNPVVELCDGEAWTKVEPPFTLSPNGLFSISEQVKLPFAYSASGYLSVLQVKRYYHFELRPVGQKKTSELS